MLENLGLGLLLLPLGIALGWALRRQWRGRPEAEQGTPVSPDYLQGLQHLAEGDSDQALAALTRAASVDSDTLEMQLTLGRLFRRRGEVDRAMRVHQHLLARDNLPAERVNELRLELARDYHEAGLLDRAEGLFSELAEDGMFLDEALRALVGIFEQTRDWERAEDTAKRLQSVAGRSRAREIAQYRCERAEMARAAGALKEAIALAESALSADAGCVRASLLLGELHEQAGQYKRAFHAYERVPEQDLRYFATVLPAIRRVYAADGKLDGYRGYLRQAEKFYQSPHPTLARLRLQHEQGENVTAQLVHLCREQPTWSGLRMLAQWQADGSEADKYLHEGLEATAQHMPQYRCSECGLTPRLQFWQCPSCKHWASVAPVPDAL